jgi:hypothetical protein
MEDKKREAFVLDRGALLACCSNQKLNLKRVFSNV